MQPFSFFPKMPFYRPYYRNCYPPSLHQKDTQNVQCHCEDTNASFSRKEPNCHLTLPIESKTSSDNNNNNVNDDILFDLFGLKLYFDDILLICLIFFLYNEDVKDEMLFISLILLLIT